MPCGPQGAAIAAHDVAAMKGGAMEAGERSRTRASRRGNHVHRLTFEYDGPAVRLVKRQRLEMLAPPSDPLTGYEGQSGFWFELQDAAGRVLYRRVLHHPLRYD